MKLLIIIFYMGLIGLLSLVIASYVSPRFFVKTAYTYVKSEFPDLPEFSSQELLMLANDQRDNYIVVDVRSLEERNISIIANSIDQTNFENNIYSYRDKKVIVYCTIGYRSGFYAQKLVEQGLDAYNLRAGVLGWLQAGGELVDSNEQNTRKVHVYSRPWNLGVKAGHIAVF